MEAGKSLITEHRFQWSMQNWILKSVLRNGSPIRTEIVRLAVDHVEIAARKVVQISEAVLLLRQCKQDRDFPNFPRESGYVSSIKAESVGAWTLSKRCFDLCRLDSYTLIFDANSIYYIIRTLTPTLTV